MSEGTLYHPKYRPDIDGLRAIAVISVLFFHAFPAKLPGGFVGVDIFFVISGYLISLILFKSFDSNTFSFLQFYARRAVRIFPALTLVLAAVATYSFYTSLPIDFKAIGSHILAGAGFASNLLLWSESGYFDKTAELKPLLHLWSLGVEEQFYIFWPFLIFIFHKKPRTLFFALVTTAFSSFVLCAFLTFLKPTAAFYFPLTRLWELGSGGILAWITLKGATAQLQTTKIAKVLSSVGLVLIFVSIFFLKSERSFPGFWATLPVLGTAFIIAAGPQDWINLKLLSNRPIVYLGLISYPLYLWHWPIFSFYTRAKFDESVAESFPMVLALVLLSFVLAIFTYYAIDLPLKKVRNRNPAGLVATGLLAAVGCFGLFVYKQGGLPKRFPEEIRVLTETIDFKFTQGARFGVCHYDSGSITSDPLPPECIEKKRPQVFIWGDSYAAALIEGFKFQQSKHSFGLVQITTCGTPPVFEINWDSGCLTQQKMDEKNKKAIELVLSLNPEILVLHSFWNAYFNQATALKKIKEMAQSLRSEGFKNKIFVIGPVPQWGNYDDSIARFKYRFWKNHQHQLPDDYMAYGVAESSFFDDELFEVELKNIGVKYLSATRALCRQKACLTTVGPLPTDTTSIDQGHLSPAGSRYLIEKFASEIFEQP